MIGFRCVLILSLILSTTLVTGHSIRRRDNQHTDESDDDDKMKMLKTISDMLKMSAQRIRGSVVMGYHMLSSGLVSDEANSTSDVASIGSGSMDDDSIIFNSDDGPDVTSAMITTCDEDKEKQDATTIPTILNRSLLDTPIACGGGQQLGKDGKCRVVW